jgi:4-diphosphocytidyl-2-C-methyl-D-erythritol kinase
MQGWSAEKSLASKAVALLKDATGCTKGAAIKIEKRIPLVSGLGGDSSDAAALLRGLNELWDLKLSQEKLAELAAKLGSDVGFFLHGGTALAKGKGEIITPLQPVSPMWLVLVMPDVPVETGKTGRMYSNLKPSHFTVGDITQKVVESLNAGKKFLPSMLYNVFENIAFEDFNVQRLYIDPLIKLGALHVHLAGSGPTLFTMFSDKARAEGIYTRCRSLKMKTYLAQTI